MTARTALALATAVTFPLVHAQAQELGIVESFVDLEPALAGALGLGAEDSLGASVAALGDLDGDGLTEIALGLPNADGPGAKGGEVWIVSLDADGSLRFARELTLASGGFGGRPQPVVRFGKSVAGIGDLNGDGLGDLAIGATEEDAFGAPAGVVWILFMNADATVQSSQKIGDGAGGFGASLANLESFGRSVAAIGDLDGDAVTELAIGADGPNGTDEGALWVLFMRPDGTVAGERFIGAGQGGFAGSLDPLDGFASALAPAGDVDEDGVFDLVVGAPGDDDGGTDRGAVWTLFLQTDGSVAGETKISSTAGSFGGALADGDRFGAALARLGELDPDPRGDVAIGAPGEAGNGSERGAIWTVFLQSDGSIEDFTKLGDGVGGFGGDLADGDRLGSSLAAVGDFDGDGVGELLTGAPGDDGVATDSGAAWLLYLRSTTVEIENGSGVNPTWLGSGTTPPSIGKVWDPIITPTSEGKSIVDFLGVSRMVELEPAKAPTTWTGELLISIDSQDLLLCSLTPPGSNFQIPIPDDPSLIGLPLFCQGAVIDPFDVTLTNALEVVVGL